MPDIDEKFVAAVKRMEKRTTDVTAAVIVDPTNPQRWGRVVITYPRDGAGRLHAVAWLPSDGTSTARHTGWASGGGYDKATAAMGGAQYVAPDGTAGTLKDEGWGWERQLQDAGFLVIRAV